MDWTPVEVQELRAALRLSLRDFARRTGVSMGSVRNWERGAHDLMPSSKRLLDQVHIGLSRAQRDRFDEALRRRREADDTTIGLADLGVKKQTLVGESGPGCGTVLATGHDVAEPEEELDLDRRRLLELALRSAAALTLSPDLLSRRTDASTSSPPVMSRGDVEAVQDMTALFSRMDQRRGGGHGRTAAGQYLATDVAQSLHGRFADGHVRRAMFSAAGEVAYLCGWMAFDERHEALFDRVEVKGLHPRFIAVDCEQLEAA